MSSRSLDDLHPEIRPMVDDFLTACSAAGLDVLVTCTRRSNAEQAALYASGRTAPGYVVTDAPAGRSAHNFGLAIDIVPLVNGKPDWKGSDPVWKQIGQIGVAAGLQWAGSPGFPFPEEPHFQHPIWRTLAGIA
jgi:peptidoglycan L-alanyl-D-glutamate endopeptidase CwlK